VERRSVDGRKPFGELLRDHRAAAGLTQEYLADRAGLSLDAVSALERGVHPNPRRRTIVLLAAALGLDEAQREELVAATRRPAATATPIDQRSAAWQLYVELTTRISVAELPAGEGLLRESLSSLYGLFGTTRAVLKELGPELASRPSPAGPSLRSIAMRMLDGVLRPFLSKWHALLLDHENGRPPGTSPAEHERAWARNEELRAALVPVRQALRECAASLAAIAEVTGAEHPPASP